jgi:hypothetical protein
MNTIKIFHFILALLILPVLGNAQPQEPGPLSKEARDKIEAQRIGFITQKLNLSPDEATKFWPIYNQHKDALKEMRDDMERPDLMSITDDEATAIIEKHLKQEEKRLELQKKLFADLRKVISPRKIIMLQAAEREFNRSLLRRMNEMHPDARHEKIH